MNAGASVSVGVAQCLQKQTFATIVLVSLLTQGVAFAESSSPTDAEMEKAIDEMFPADFPWPEDPDPGPDEAGADQPFERWLDELSAGHGANAPAESDADMPEWPAEDANLAEGDVLLWDAIDRRAVEKPHDDDERSAGAALT